MPWDGNGNFILNQDFPADRDAGPPDSYIQADLVDNEFQNIRVGLNNVRTLDGQNSPSADLPMNTRKHTNVGLATGALNYLRADQAQKNTISYLTSVGGTADAITATAALSLSALTAGMQFTFIPGSTNTATTPTLNINSIGAKTIKKGASAALAVGDIVSGRPADVFYDGTDFILLNPPSLSTFGGTVTGAVTFSVAGNQVVFRNTQNDTAGRNILVIERGDGTGDDLVLSSVGDGTNGVASMAFNFANGSVFIFRKDGTLGVGADGSASGDAVRKGQMDTAIATATPDASDTVKGKIEIAIGSEVAAASSNVLAVPPGRMHQHPGIAKAWVNFNGTGTVAIRDSHGVTSITDNGTGDYTVNLSITMANANYAILTAAGPGVGGSGASYASIRGADPTTTAFRIQSLITATLTDREYVCAGIFGDQT